jgi:hypothetical protein
MSRLVEICRTLLLSMAKRKAILAPRADSVFLANGAAESL